MKAPVRACVMVAALLLAFSAGGALPVRADVASDGLRLQYPALGIDLPVFQGYFNPDGTPAVPYSPIGAWHYPTMNWPGQGLRSLLFAHDQPGYFDHLVNAQPGDQIKVLRSDGRVLVYTVVINELIAYNDTSWLSTGDHDQLVLLTCISWTDTDPRRIVVADGVFAPTSVPLNVAATSGQNSATVSWSAPDYLGWSPPTAYLVQALPSGGSVSVPAWQTSVNVNKLSWGTAYQFRVTAQNAAGYSAWSSLSNQVTPYPRLIVRGPPTSTAGNQFAMEADAVDANGSVYTGYNTQARVSSGDAQAVLPNFGAPATFSSGVGAYSMTLKTAGVQSVTVTDANNALVSGSTTISVSPAATSQIAVDLPAMVAERSLVTFTVRASDPYGNTTPWYTGTIALSASIPGASFNSAGYTYTAADAGRHAFQASFSPAGQPVTVSAADSGGGLSGATTGYVAYVYYFTWYDSVSPGFTADNIHVVNPNPSAAVAAVDIPSSGSPCPHLQQSIAPGGEAILTCATGLGGPVMVLATLPVQVTQRVVYGQSFSEIPAFSLSAAAPTLYLSWYDTASPGATTDNVHVLNPGPQPATVTAQIPGCASQSQGIAPGAEGVFTCPGGNGGPVVITSSGNPILASQRTIYNSGFNEADAMSPAYTDNSLWLSWYDLTSPGFSVDNIHVVNPGPLYALLHVALPGCGVQTTSLGPGGETVFSCGSGYGGPVHITSEGNPVLASQRVVYNGTISETLAQPASAAAQRRYLTWYDDVSAGFGTDLVMVVNPGQVPSSVNVWIPGCAVQTATLLGDNATYFSCPSSRGGPVVITGAGSPILASQRVSYYGSFNEAGSGAEPCQMKKSFSGCPGAAGF